MKTQLILNWMWGLLGLYWLSKARRSGNIAVQEASWWRVIRLLILTITFVLLLSPWLRIGVLGRRFLPGSLFVSIAGIIATGLGMLLCVWARLYLGKYWSDKVMLKQDHQLVRSGPYQYLRHPIYSGVLLGILGSAIAIGEWRGLVAFAIMSTNYFVKARREERVLVGHFGAKYAEYRKQAGFLAPWIL